jgi:hypothetical protein
LFLVFEDAPAYVGVKADKERDGRVLGVRVECVGHPQDVAPGSLERLWRLRQNTVAVSPPVQKSGFSALGGLASLSE